MVASHYDQLYIPPNQHVPRRRSRSRQAIKAFGRAATTLLDAVKRHNRVIKKKRHRHHPVCDRFLAAGVVLVVVVGGGSYFFDNMQKSDAARDDYENREKTPIVVKNCYDPGLRKYFSLTKADLDARLDGKEYPIVQIARQQNCLSPNKPARKLNNN